MRVKALLRRYCVYGARPPGLERRLRCGGLEVDTAAGTVWQEGREVPLTELEYRIVLLLASYPNKIFSAENFYESHLGGAVTFTAVRTPSWSTSATTARR